MLDRDNLSILGSVSVRSAFPNRLRSRDMHKLDGPWQKWRNYKSKIRFDKRPNYRSCGATILAIVAKTVNVKPLDGLRWDSSVQGAGELSLSALHRKCFNHLHWSFSHDTCSWKCPQSLPLRLYCLEDGTMISLFQILISNGSVGTSSTDLSVWARVTWSVHPSVYTYIVWYDSVYSYYIWTRLYITLTSI